MYKITKKLEVAGAHKLELPYESKCSNLHGHNWIITVELQSDKLTEYGMVMDFTHIKKLIHEPLDHSYINNVIPGINPTAENIAKWIADRLTGEFDGIYVVCTRVEVEESPNNTAIYEVKGGCNCGK